LNGVKCKKSQLFFKFFSIMVYKKGNQALTFLVALFMGVVLSASMSVWATSIGTNISVDGTLTVTGASTHDGNTTLGNASTDINLFTGTLQASTTALFTGAVTTYGSVTLGDASADTLTVNATSTFAAGVTINAGGLSVTVGGLTIANNGTISGGLGVGTTGTSTAGAIQTSGPAQFDTDLSVTDDAVITGGLGVGTTGTTTNGSLQVSGAVQLGTDLSVVDDALVTSGLGVGTTGTTTDGSLEVSGASLFGGIVNLNQSGTSTISAKSTTATRGGCIELEGADGASTFSIYATSAQVAMITTGACR
jgi:autotransporter-associated beta strand protein